MVTKVLLVNSILLVLPLTLYSWEASWKSLDSRPLPEWYDEAKFGIFIHWGVFSVPAYDHSPWFWYWWQAARLEDYQKFIYETEVASRFAYQDYAERFDATLYRPDQWANVIAHSGAQYAVITSKHHDGFCNWDSRDVPATWNWNAMDVGPQRDLIGDFATAMKKITSPHTNNTIRFGLYHSMLEFFNTAYRQDVINNYTTQDFVDTKALPELYDLVRKYEPHLLWGDGTWEGTSDYWKATEFLSWYATNSSVAEEAVWNDRWGSDCLSRHGGFFTPSDRYDPGHLLTHKWEDAMTININSWGYEKDATIGEFTKTRDLVHLLIETVAFGGNLLVNIGPGPDGTIQPIMLDRLVGMGEWLRLNGEAIYGSRPWKRAQNETAASTFYTKKGKILYALFTQWPTNSTLHLRYAPNTTRQVTMLGIDDVALDFSKDTNGMHVQLGRPTPNQIPCHHAWVLKMRS